MSLKSQRKAEKLKQLFNNTKEQEKSLEEEQTKKLLKDKGFEHYFEPFEEDLLYLYKELLSEKNIKYSYVSFALEVLFLSLDPKSHAYFSHKYPKMINDFKVFLNDKDRSIMLIESNGIKFFFSDWDFDCDGDYGHIYFTVPGKTFKIGSNNGAYASEGIMGFQIVHMATPCMEREFFILDNLKSILQEAADTICINLERA